MHRIPRALSFPMAKFPRFPFKIVRTRPADSAQRRPGSRALRLTTSAERTPLSARISPVRAALAVGTILALTALVSFHLVPDQVGLRIGDHARDDIRAERTVSYTDIDATEALREAAASRVDPIYTPLRYATPEAIETITEVCGEIQRARPDGDRAASHLARQFSQNLDIQLSSPHVLAPILADPSSYHFDDLRRTLKNSVHDTMERDIRESHPEDLAAARDAVSDKIRSSMLPRSYLPAALAIATAVIRENRTYDAARTRAARDAERRLVAPEKATIFTGDLVVARGELVTPQTVDKLRALGLQNPRIRPASVICAALLIALMLLIVQVYLSRFLRSV